MSISLINVRLEASWKQEMEEHSSSLDLNMTSTIDIFL